MMPVKRSALLSPASTRTYEFRVILPSVRLAAQSCADLVASCAGVMALAAQAAVLRIICRSLMALRARSVNVSVVLGETRPGSGMAICGRRPSGVRGMTRRAIRREVQVRHWCCRLCHRPAMAGVAGGSQSGVHVVHVAIGTCDRRVPSGQGEGRLAVVERRRLPGCHRMTRRAIAGEPSMRRCRRPVEVALVTTDAGRGQSDKYIIHVALRARYRLMGAGQREERLAMIKRRRLPGCRRVACCAILREAGMRRSRRSREILLMAAIAARR
jgi:hypothetical protein